VTKSLLLLSSLFLISLSAKADLFEVPEVKAVMNQKYQIGDEINFSFSYLPVGAINKYLSLGGSYLKYFNASHGWEVINFQYAIELESQLKRDLQKPPFNAQKDELPVLQFIGTSNYVFSPFYSKSVLFNSSIVHSELSFLAGGGLASFTTEVIPVADLGLNQRFFLESGNSFKFEFRYYAFIANKELLRNQMALTATYSIPWGRSMK
jgi:outer membrane beta-barrel protein